MAREGQATADVEVRGDTIYVTATCDSLKALCLKYENELTRVRSEAEQLKKEIGKNSFWALFKWYLTGVLTGFIIGVIVTIKIKRKWQK